MDEIFVENNLRNEKSVQTPSHICCDWAEKDVHKRKLHHSSQDGTVEGFRSEDSSAVERAHCNMYKFQRWSVKSDSFLGKQKVA
jgi:hypothetical protein